MAKLSDDGSSLHFWFKAWTAFVVVGVILEIVFCICEYLEERHELRVCDLIPRTVPTLWLFAFGMFAASLVAIGVSGELKVEDQIETLESCVRTGNDTLFLLLSKEAGDAAQSAKTAKADAKTAHDEAELAKDIARKAETDANNADARALDAEAKLAEAEKRRAELEESVAPRDLIFSDIVGGPANGLSSREAIKPFDDFIATLYWIKDPEAERAAAWIYRALCGTGWTVEAMDGEICHKSTVPDVKSISPSPVWEDWPGLRQLPMRKMPLEGVQIFSYFPDDLSKPGAMREKQRSEDASHGLAEYLAASGWTGIVEEVSPSGTMNPGTISVRVGFKPNPFLGKLTIDKAQKIMNQVLKEHNIPETPPEVRH